MNYKVFNLKTITETLQLSSSKKGISTEKFLENVIMEINRSGKFTFHQFFQLVDVFYVVVIENEIMQPRTMASEINNHYNVDLSQESTIPVKKVDARTDLKKEPLPWKH